MVSRAKANVSVLLSGGIDSTACIQFYHSRGFKVSALNINYGQMACKNEITAASKIADYYDIPLKLVTYNGRAFLKTGQIRARNAFFLTAALLEFEGDKGIIAIGVHAGTQYADCSELFINQIQAVFNTYEDGKFRLGAPFLTWDKGQIWEYAKAENIPLDLTYSCELGLKQPCGKCFSCQDLEKLYAREK